MSNHHQVVPEGKDPVLWDIAHRRAGFKRHFTTYVIVIGFLWGIWFVTGNQHRGIDFNSWSTSGYPWPVWPSLGWGIGLAFHYASAYVNPQSNSTGREYDKLKKRQAGNDV